MSSTVIPTIPDEYTQEQGSVKLFNKWSFDDIEVKDIAVTDYMQIRNHIFLPHTAGRYQSKRFRKAQVNYRHSNLGFNRRNSARSLSE